MNAGFTIHNHYNMFALYERKRQDVVCKHTRACTNIRALAQTYTSLLVLLVKYKSRSEPGNAPRIGIGHRKVVCQKKL